MFTMSGSARPSGNTHLGGITRNILHLIVESNNSLLIKNTKGIFNSEIAPDPYSKGNRELSYTYS